MPEPVDRLALDADRRMALAQEWDELVDEVRGLPGFGDFLRPPGFETLLPAAAGGPVVVVNVSRWRCDALIVSSSGVETVELTELTQRDVVTQVQAYLDFFAAGRIRDVVTTDGDAEPVEDRLDSCLRWMWDSFAGQILDRPEFAGDFPRVWWCPTGPLALLPIHAAGYHHVPGKSVLDRVVSSYTPTLRALVDARNGRNLEPARQRMLFVGMPSTPGQQDLPNVEREERLLVNLFGDRCTPLVSAEATRAAVTDALPGHGWVHFACHGEQNLADPSHGGLLVQDGSLTVTDLAAGTNHGDFAYLSGCKTALGGANLPDEAITLAAALHYTGFRHVVATLWSVQDDEAAKVAEDVYGTIVRDGLLHADESATALHHAVRALRTANPDRPSVWTPFAHTGP